MLNNVYFLNAVKILVNKIVSIPNAFKYFHLVIMHSFHIFEILSYVICCKLCLSLKNNISVL